MNRSRQGLSFELLRSKIHRVDAEKCCAKDNRILFDKKNTVFRTLSERALSAASMIREEVILNHKKMII